MTPIDYPTLLATLSIDLVLLYLVAYVFFYRRHGRRDVFVAISLVNITLYVLGGALGTFTISLGLGFALFSVISIFRLRSETLGWNEIVYLTTFQCRPSTLRSLPWLSMLLITQRYSNPRLFKSSHCQLTTLRLIQRC
ncbi:MAG: DUF4956 domain-containing protein [Microbacteriaceae bacterium]|nr:DUF4956 domain-containing protein [Microbacteriaceae bacterium]